MHKYVERQIDVSLSLSKSINFKKIKIKKLLHIGSGQVLLPNEYSCQTWVKKTNNFLFQSLLVFRIADKGLRDGGPAQHLHKVFWNLPALLSVPYHFLSQWLLSSESETEDAPLFHIPLGIKKLSVTLWYTIDCMMRPKISEVLKCGGNHQPWNPWSMGFVYLHYFWLIQHRAWSQGTGPRPISDPHQWGDLGLIT